MRILIIEDDRDAAQYLAKGLRESGHSAEVAEDGREGLLRAAVEPFDVLIGADCAYSAVRSRLQRTDRFIYEQN